MDTDGLKSTSKVDKELPNFQKVGYKVIHQRVCMLAPSQHSYRGDCTMSVFIDLSTDEFTADQAIGGGDQLGKVG